MLDGIVRPPPFTTPESNAPSLTVRRFIVLPSDTYWLALFNGAISLLCKEHNWLVPDGHVSAEDAAQVFREAFVSMRDNYMLGTIVPVMLDPIPDYMLLCDGSNYSGDDFPELYAVIGDEFKEGDGTFSVPNLMGRFIIGHLPVDEIEGIDFPINTTGGEYDHFLTVSELPDHTHTIPDHTHTIAAHSHTIAAGNSAGSTANTVARTSISAGTVTTSSETPTINAASLTASIEGDGDGHNNIPPYRALRYAMYAK